MKTLVKLLLFAFLATVYSCALAQQLYKISGTIKSQEGEPLKSATVFINGSRWITFADEQGRFEFRAIPSGAFKVTVSMVGYEPLTHDVLVKSNSLYFEMQLQPKVIDLKEVRIGNDRNWYKNFELFKQYFLGRSANARQCIIVNPKIINFSTRKGVLMADADDFLIIENKRLGYRIRYLLQNFELNLTDHVTNYGGGFSFEELTGTEKQKKEWAKNRADTYKGSFKHFLRTVYADNSVENGFLVRPLFGYATMKQDSLTLDRYRLMVVDTALSFDSLRRVVDSNFIALKFDQLYVIYNPKRALSYQLEALKKPLRKARRSIVLDIDASQLKLSIPEAIIDKKGNYTNSHTFFIKGRWADARMGDELPVDYKQPFPEIKRGDDPVNRAIAAGFYK